LLSKAICVVGTRPEVIKMAPVVRALERAGVETSVLVTAQHRALLDQMLEVFGLTAKWDLDLMQPNQSLCELTGRLIPGLGRILREAKPSVVLAQGDTTTVLCAALTAFYEGIPFGHVEAGLRSGNLTSPFPEEANRRLASVLARWHFAPTEMAAEALRQEGIAPSQIHVVGNTVIDSLLDIAKRPDLPWNGLPEPSRGERLVLVTLHRRENFGAPIREILGHLRNFACRHPEAILLYPIHPNPNVKEPAEEILAGLPNVHLVEPLDYPTLVHALKKCHLVLTDSGGIQEEAPAIGKPVLVFRDVTERPEAVQAGGVRLVGGRGEGFPEAAEELWSDGPLYEQMAVPRFPFGTGHSAESIVQILTQPGI